MLRAALKMTPRSMSASEPYSRWSNQSLWGQVLGIDILSGCKGEKKNPRDLPTP